MTEPVVQMPDEECLRDSEVALMDAIKAVLEIVIAKGISKPETIAEIFSRMSQQYPQDAMPRAVFVMEALRDFASDPQRQELRQLLQKSPSGSA